MRFLDILFIYQIISRISEKETEEEDTESEETESEETESEETESVRD